VTAHDRKHGRPDDVGMWPYLLHSLAVMTPSLSLSFELVLASVSMDADLVGVEIVIERRGCRGARVRVHLSSETEVR
jgi:hypothetical protein